MAISNIWVVVEPGTSGLTTTSLELLTNARTYGATVSAITWENGSSLAAST